MFPLNRLKSTITRIVNTTINAPRALIENRAENWARAVAKVKQTKELLDRCERKIMGEIVGGFSERCDEWCELIWHNVIPNLKMLLAEKLKICVPCEGGVRIATLKELFYVRQYDKVRARIENLNVALNKQILAGGSVLGSYSLAIRISIFWVVLSVLLPSGKIKFKCPRNRGVYPSAEKGHSLRLIMMPMMLSVVFGMAVRTVIFNAVLLISMHALLRVLAYIYPWVRVSWEYVEWWDTYSKNHKNGIEQLGIAESLKVQNAIILKERNAIAENYLWCVGNVFKIKRGTPRAECLAAIVREYSATFLIPTAVRRAAVMYITTNTSFTFEGVQDLNPKLVRAMALLRRTFWNAIIDQMITLRGEL